MCQIEDFCCQNPLCPDAGIRKKVTYDGMAGAAINAKSAAFVV